MTLELLYMPGCPHHEAAIDLIHDVLNQRGLKAEFTETVISNCDEAKRHSFPGSPTLRVNGRDVEDLAANRLPVGFACRTYWVNGRPQGVPPRAWLERAVRAGQLLDEGRQ
jgi:hypothetical protein